MASCTAEGREGWGLSQDLVGLQQPRQDETNGRREGIAMASKEPETFRSKMTPVPGMMFMFPSKAFSTLLEH